MPAVDFTIRWPDGARQRCSSPSTVIHEHLSLGMRMSVSEFVQRSAHALQAAGERVRQRYGFACSAAVEQQEAIAEVAARYPADDDVHVVALDGMQLSEMRA